MYVSVTTILYRKDMMLLNIYFIYDFNLYLLIKIIIYLL